MAARDSAIEWLTLLFHKLEEQLLKDDVRQIKGLLTPKFITRRRADEITNAFDIFVELREKAYITETNLDLLVDVLKAINRIDLCDVISKKLSEVGNSSDSGIGVEAAKKCKELLKDHYEKTAMYVDPVPCYEYGFQLPILNMYTKLELVNRSKEGHEYTKVDFRKDLANKKTRRILVEGDPGIGKSTFCRKMALDWALNTEPMLEKYELLILLELRQIVDSADIVKAVFDQLLPENPGINETDLRNYFDNNQDKILIVLDGADELQQDLRDRMIRLMKGKIYPKSTVIISSRGTDVNTYVKFVDKHYIIRGFSKENVREFITKYSIADNKAATSENNDDRACTRITEQDVKDNVAALTISESSNDAHEIDKTNNVVASTVPEIIRMARAIIEEIEKNDNVSALAINPLNAILLCLLWKDNKGELPSQLSELYTSMFMSILRRYCERQNLPVPEGNEIPREYKEDLIKLGKMAYDGLKSDKVRFDKKDVADSGIPMESHVFTLGLLTQEYSSARLQPGKFWVFIHKSFQEYMAAYYLIQTNQTSDRGSLQSVIRDSKLRNTCLFVAGLLGKDGDVLFRELDEILHITKNDQMFEESRHFALSCLHESGCPELFVRIIARRVIRDNKIHIGVYVSTATNACQSGLNHVIRYCNQNADVDESFRLYTLYLYSQPITKQTLAVLAECHYLHTLSVSVSDDCMDDLIAVVAVNPIKVLQIRIDSQNDTYSVMTSLANLLSKSSNLAAFGITLYNGDNHDVAEYRSNTSKYHSLFQLNDTLRHLIIEGYEKSEIFFTSIGRLITTHSSMTYLETRFRGNALLAERRRTLAEILRNNAIKVLRINTERHDNYTAVGGARVKFQFIPRRYGSGFSTAEIESGKQASGMFYDSITHCTSLQCLYVDHWGDDDDLTSILSSVKSNQSVRVMFILTESLTTEVAAAMRAMLEGSQTLRMLGVASVDKVCAMDDVVTEHHRFDRIKFVPDDKQDKIQNSGLAYNEVNGALQAATFIVINTNPGDDTQWDVTLTRIKKKLLEYYRPRIVKAGYHINIWERK